MTNKKAPSIRFKGFTDDWEQRKFSDDNDLITGYPFESEKYVEEGISLIRGMNVKRGYLDLSDEICMKWDSAEGLENYLLEDGDILIQMDGALIGKSYARIAKNQLPALLVQRVTRARAKKDIANSAFMYQTIQRDFLTYIKINKTETAVPHLSLNDIRDFMIMAPSLEEQKRLGELFTNLDNLITLHQRECERLQIVKKSMLENMFPKNGERVPKIRFSGFTDDWEQRKLADVAEIIGGGTPSTSNPDYWDGDIDWYAPAEIGERIFAYESVRKITKEGLIHSSAKILPAHKTVLFTSRAGIGNMAILKRPAATNQGFQSLVCHDDIDPYFMFSMGDSIKAKAERVAAGSTFAEISGKKLGDLEFMFPRTNEQKAIGGYFKNLDSLITLHQSKLEKLRLIKKSMLEQMFV